MRLSFRLAVRNGIRRFQIADPSNDPASLVRLARMVREEGAEEVVVGLTYSISPVAHPRLLRRARQRRRRLAGHRPALPEGPRRAAHAGRGARADPARSSPPSRRGRSSCTATARSGSGPLAYVEGLRAGVRTLHTAVAPVASGTSNPPAETTLRNLEAEGFSHRLDTEALAAGVRALPRAGARPRPAAGRAGRVRRRLLPPPDARRHGHDHAPDARRGRPPGAVRRGARGGHARARGDGLPDHGHAGLPVRGHAGDDERDLRRALARRLRRDGALLPRPLLRAGGAGGPAGRGASAVAAARRRAARARAARAWRARASASASASRRRSCCCG